MGSVSTSFPMPLRNTDPSLEDSALTITTALQQYEVVCYNSGIDYPDDCVMNKAGFRRVLQGLGAQGNAGMGWLGLLFGVQFGWNHDDADEEAQGDQGAANAVAAPPSEGVEGGAATADDDHGDGNGDGGAVGQDYGDHVVANAAETQGDEAAGGDDETQPSISSSPLVDKSSDVIEPESEAELESVCDTSSNEDYYTSTDRDAPSSSQSEPISSSFSDDMELARSNDPVGRADCDIDIEMETRENSETTSGRKEKGKRKDARREKNMANKGKAKVDGGAAGCDPAAPLDADAPPAPPWTLLPSSSTTSTSSEDQTTAVSTSAVPSPRFRSHVVPLLTVLRARAMARVLELEDRVLELEEAEAGRGGENGGGGVVSGAGGREEGEAGGARDADGEGICGAGKAVDGRA
ncbi:hypothetical protein HDU93_008716 [Gonapodya sp. JEL0774]|nr:hypothetical protein HDU93_008716 [Gonapodya sp. JEL0774]